MRIDSVELQNIGPHEKLQVEFQSGLIGLLGSNGAGKSTLVNSVYAALTNDFTRFSNVKADIITNNTKGHSFIRIKGSHHKQNFELTRWLRPNKNELVIDGQVWTKANDVNDQVQAQLGISKLVIDKYVFVDQWAMFQFLSQTDSERAKTFQYLCGTEAATRIHKVCADFVSNQKGVEIVDNSLELGESIAAIQTQMDHHKEKGRAAKLLILPDAELERVKQIIEAQEKASEAQDTLASNEQHIGQAKTDRKKLKVRREKVQTKITEDKAKLASVNSTELETAREVVDNWDEFKDLDSEISQLEEAIEKMESDQEEADKGKPVKSKLSYIKEEDRAAKQKTKGELEFQQEQDYDLVNEFEPDEEHECPKCHQPVTADHIHSATTQYAEREVTLKLLTENLDYSAKFDRQQQKYLKGCQSRADALVTLNEGLTVAQAKKAKAPGLDAYQDASMCISKFEELEDYISEGESVITNLDLKLSRLDGRIQSSEEYSVQLQKQIDACPSGEDVKAAAGLVEAHTEAVVSHKVAVRCFKEAKANRAKLRNTLEQLKLRLKQKAKVKELLTTIAAAGEVFHWNNLPKTVSQANLELLVDDINANLEMFNHPFYVEADQDLTFKVFLPGKSPVKAKQLSGGQKVILAIAFRAALDRVFGHDVGMMYLDEPTAGLDADNVTYFHDALQQLAEKVHGDRQLVVITHVQELGGVFDQLIEI